MSCAHLGIQGEVAVRLKHNSSSSSSNAVGVLVVYCFYFYIYLIYSCSLFSCDYRPIKLRLPLEEETCKQVPANKRGNVCINVPLSAFTWSFLPCESQKYYLSWVSIYNLSSPTCKVQFVVIAWQALSHFSTLSHKRHDFREKVIENKICFDFLYNFCLKHFSL